MVMRLCCDDITDVVGKAIACSFLFCLYAKEDLVVGDYCIGCKRPLVFIFSRCRVSNWVLREIRCVGRYLVGEIVDFSHVVKLFPPRIYAHVVRRRARMDVVREIFAVICKIAGERRIRRC